MIKECSNEVELPISLRPLEHSRTSKMVTASNFSKYSVARKCNEIDFLKILTTAHHWN